MFKWILSVCLSAACFCGAEQTLSIIKPDAVADHKIGQIIATFEENGLTITQLKMLRLSEDQAKQFYAVHKDRPFYPELVKFMTSGPVVVMVLDGDQAVSKNRQLMGATDPAKAEKGTLRARFGKKIRRFGKISDIGRPFFCFAF